ncbi:MAG: UTP--glucose-1-phosphate uridylyltransferase [Bacteroidia bacterium]
MTNPFLETIVSNDREKQNQSFFSLAAQMPLPQLLQSLAEVDQFRMHSESLYHRVRACLFLYAGYRFFVQEHPDLPRTGNLPSEGFADLLQRRFEYAITAFHRDAADSGMNGNLASGLAEAYHHLSFQILSDQVRKSVRASKGNQWLFRGGNIAEHPIRFHSLLLKREGDRHFFPILTEHTPVRLDLSHSCWSDIFFLGMDYPEGARVINISVDLGVFGRDREVKPPISTHIRVIAEPLIRLTSIDLNTTRDITDLKDLFNFGNDYLSLLKAGIIASGLIPPSFESTGQCLKEILSKIVGTGLGIELVTSVNDIPKGSRFAVSTNLLGSIISVLMRATGQTQSLEGGLTEGERRMIASRAILGEWLGGSGGGWQDSGGIWPGIKMISGTLASEGDPEFGISRGCLLPRHKVITSPDLHPDMEKLLTENLLLMHGGMAQNVGPVLEMVTEKYLLRAEREWNARKSAGGIFDSILSSLKTADIGALAAATTRNFDGPIKAIIPAATNAFTERVISKAKTEFGNDYLGFLMLGGMSGGGMGMFVKTKNQQADKVKLLEILRKTKQEFAPGLPFAMEPVVYNFSVNNQGSFATLKHGNYALMPSIYYNIHVSGLVNGEPSAIPFNRKEEFDYFTTVANPDTEVLPLLRTMVSSLFKVNTTTNSKGSAEDHKVAAIKSKNGFDAIQHETLRRDMIRGRIGLARNRLPAETLIEDVDNSSISELEKLDSHCAETGETAIRQHSVAVFSLAGGAGSRWTQGAGVIKALNPFVEIAGKHRSFLEVHLTKTTVTAEKLNAHIPHIIATSYLTQEAIRDELLRTGNFGYKGHTYLSAGRSIGQRFIPMERDLKYLWEETPQEMLDENKQKVKDAVRNTLVQWATEKGEGNDYTENLAEQRLSPLGHWYEVSNLLRNGTLSRMLKEIPSIKTLMLHNIDTLGADLDPRALGYHLQSGNMLTFEVVPRRIEDRGGGLATVNGKVRLLEGLAQPGEDDELKLSYYNSMTTWIDIDQLMGWFGLNREQLLSGKMDIDTIVRDHAWRLPTYVTIKNVKYRWGHGQEDIYPVAQMEKLWSDMSSLPDVTCGFLAVPRKRGQQLKDPAQLDAWITDGSKEYISRLCGWEKE